MGRSVDKKLTDQEHLFVEEYLVNLCPHKAALKAKYSKTVATSKAFQWVSNSKLNPKPHVRAAIQKAIDERSDRTKITQDNVLRGIAEIAFPKPDRKTTDRDRLIALGMAGKHLGMFADKQLPKDEAQNSAKIDALIADAEARAGGNGKTCH